jgi:hypothetical protein
MYYVVDLYHISFRIFMYNTLNKLPLDYLPCEKTQKSHKLLSVFFKTYFFTFKYKWWNYNILLELQFHTIFIRTVSVQSLEKLAIFNN